MTSLYINCVKLCVNYIAKPVQKNVYFLNHYIFRCKTLNFSHLLPIVFHQLFNNYSIGNNPNTYPLFHSHYYYHYYIKNNINN